jgi:hypothetical protein
VHDTLMGCDKSTLTSISEVCALMVVAVTWCVCARVCARACKQTGILFYSVWSNCGADIKPSKL